MDIKASGKEVTPELARELLIAISNSVPDNVPSLDTVVLKNVDRADGAAAMANGDVAEKYRMAASKTTRFEKSTDDNYSLFQDF